MAEGLKKHIDCDVVCFGTRCLYFTQDILMKKKSIFQIKDMCRIGKSQH